MKILQVKKTSFYDVFIGFGWKHWTRVQVVKNKGETALKFVSGRHLSPSLVKQVASLLIS